MYRDSQDKYEYPSPFKDGPLSDWVADKSFGIIA
jgi:hypothetical protein